ncbi:hypothetical protein LINPERPRIM_LOCUS30224 [Linum perenne]
MFCSAISGYAEL